jgi:bifunctional non-homologous end joining protein LigD/DNA ligase-1
MTGWLDRKISPMLASSSQPFDSPKHLFEVKWDGIRTVAFSGNNKVRLQSRNLNDSTKRYPEIVEALLQIPGEAVLDGEIIVLEDGKPSFQRVLEREQIRAPDKVALRARHHPAIYMVFDILYLNGKELLSEPLTRRRELLSDLVNERATSSIVESTFILEHGKAYFQEASDRGLEGIVAKLLESPYVPGKRTNYWVKIKVQRTTDCIVLGTVIEPGTDRVRSLVIGAYRNDGLTWLGNVGSGLDRETLDGLARDLWALKGEPPEDMKVSAPGEVRWLKPALVVRVKYMELTREGRLRAPVFVGFVDTAPENCKAPRR